MSKYFSLLILVAVSAFDTLGTSRCSAAEAPVSETYGWRGNWTGRFPEANPPVRCGRTAKGILAGLTYQAARPAEQSARGSQSIEDGLIRDWLVIGPFPVKDSVEEFDADQLAGEAEVQPDEGNAVGGLMWKRLIVEKPPDYERWGTTELDWIDVAEVVGYKPNQLAYSHTYLHCRRPGKVELVVDHAHGMKAWVNGKQVYANPQRGMGLGSYVGISRQKRDLLRHSCAPFSHQPAAFSSATLGIRPPCCTGRKLGNGLWLTSYQRLKKRAGSRTRRLELSTELITRSSTHVFVMAI